MRSFRIVANYVNIPLVPSFFLHIWRLFVEKRKCSMPNLPFEKVTIFSRVWRTPIEFYLRISQHRSIPTIFICFHLLFIGSCAIMRWSFVWWKKFRLMDWKIGLNCQSYSLHLQCNSDDFWCLSNKQGCFCAPAFEGSSLHVHIRFTVNTNGLIVKLKRYKGQLP